MDTTTRRDFLRSGLAAAAVGSTAGMWTVPSTAYAGRRRRRQRRPFIAYSRDSYFRRPVDGSRIDRQRTRAFRSFMQDHPDQRDYAHPRINGVDGNEWGTSFAVGRGRHPIWRVRQRDNDNPRAKVLETDGFHAPEWLGDVLTGTSDSPFCVIDRASGFTVFCTDAKVVDDHLLDIGHGAVTWHRSNGLDYRNWRSDDERNFTSRGRISDAMVIRRDLVRFGVANDADLGHVLHMFLVETRTEAGYCHPMVGCEDGKSGFGAEGERIAIHPRINLARRGLSPEALVIARTLQNYGCYIGDNSGSASSLKAEQESKNHRVWRGRLDRDALQGITWDDFVVIR